ESSSTVRISSRKIYDQAYALEAVVVFNWADFARFSNELTPAKDAIIFHEEKDAPPATLQARFVPVAFAAASRDAGAPNGKNILALGILSAAFGLPADAIRAAIRGRFAKKAEAIIEGNLKAFERGIVIGSDVAVKKFAYKKTAPKLMMSGNEATAVAAIDAGCRFFAGYPITPSSEVLHFLSEWLPKIGGACLQTEDELAAIGAVVGGSFAGVKSMTATSGPGMALMAEMIGLSSMAEIPAVVYNVQRGGPSTGIPTKSEQSDLLHAVFASHGDTPRAVIACSDVEDSYHATVDAFNIAEEFQLPVIVLSEQSIAQRRETIASENLTHEVIDRRLATPDELADYKRYRITENGISPMSVPGMANGEYQTNGLEHDEKGSPSSMYVVHEKMNDKRYRKLEALAEKYRLFERIGPATADLGIICWGSTAGVVREAIERLNVGDLRVAAFIPKMIVPLPKKELEEFIASCNELLVIELSHSKQFYQYLRTQVDLPKKTRVYARSGGKSLGVSEVIEQCVAEVLA
ncbi:MAG TPA: 2-oxoacid:acceptor oxidoreductase subunit alpha, partial [Thermoanaerobaculia bacterium]|nr:2-oxoacid:acceptor oxidoreductase subunit alpha [Thermoanaerobaculia bacterium]